MKRLVALMVLAALTLFYPRSGFPQAGEELKALRKELEALKKGLATVQKELEELKTLVKAKQAPAPAQPQTTVVSVAEAPFKGKKTAKLTLIDFSDFQ